MGYRSNVAIAIDKKDYIDMLKKITKIEELETKNIIKKFVKSSKRVIHPYNSDYIVIEWEWVKWYSGYTEIKFIIDFLNDKIYDFVRIGENIDDIEYDYYTDLNLLDINREIILG